MLMFLMAAVFVAGPYTDADARDPVTIKVGKEGVKITILDGTAKALSPGQRDWQAVRLNDVVHGGDEVFTGAKSRMEIAMPDGSRMRFAEKTRFILQRMDPGDEKKGKNVRVHVVVGRTWANVMKATTGRSVFEISCNNAVAGVRGTIYRMNVNEDKSALVKVYDGTVEVSRWTGLPSKEPLSAGPPKKVAGPTPVPGPKKVSMEEWTFILSSMQQISINADGTTEKPKNFDAQEDLDDWVLWNKSQDGNGGNQREDKT